MKKYDVAIIGCGVVGAMTARELSKYNLKTVVLEKNSDPAMGATGANSGIVHAGFDAKEGSLKALLNVKGNITLPQIAKELGVNFKANGSLVIGYNDEDREELNILLERGIKNGVENLEIVEYDRLHEMEPELSEDIKFALYAKDGGIICPYNLAIAAIGNAMDNGVELIRDYEVTNIERRENYIINNEIEAEYVINAAGVYADVVAKMADRCDFEITPRRGDYILLDKECGNLFEATIFRAPTKMGKGVLVSPTVDGNLILGPTAVNIEDKEGKITTKDGFDNINSEITKRVKNMPAGKVITSFAGVRAVGSTGDFIINIENKFLNLCGIESPGLTASPAIAEYAVSLLKEDGLKLYKKDNFNPIRKSSHWFSKLTDEEKNEVIKKDSTFGRVICRCETVTEGEIIEAIKTNPSATTVDGVKKRTRGGMGRCQGGFCMPLVMEILAREHNLPLKEIRKSNYGSEIVAEELKVGESK